jgi:hypothetical protein
MLTAAGVRPDCRLERRLICFETTVGSFWKKTRQSDRFECSRCRNQYSSTILLPYLESAQTLVLCRFWLQCSHGLRRRSCPDRSQSLVLKHTWQYNFLINKIERSHAIFSSKFCQRFSLLSVFSSINNCDCCLLSS